MVMPDVNVLVYAHRADTREHDEHAEWLSRLASGDEPFALSELVLQAFVRVVTNPRIFVRPSTVDEALAFIEELKNQPTCHLVRPGPRHWDIFVALCRRARATAGLVSDAYHAAVAIE